jgi:hypothetical protein
VAVAQPERADGSPAVATSPLLVDRVRQREPAQALEEQACKQVEPHARAPVVAQVAAQVTGLAGRALTAAQAQPRAEPERVSE